MIGVFCSLDLVVFYLFFEAGLIPMFLIIGIWGGERRIYASFKFFLYTLLGSVLMLIAIIYIYKITNTLDIEKALKDSLKNLQVDFIDLYQIHSWQDSIPMEETITKLLDLKSKGYFKHLGVSNFSSEQIKAMNEFSGNQIISSQPHFSILFRHSEKEIIPESNKLGIGSIVYSPIARGLLSGKYKPGHIFDKDDARHNHHTFENEHLEKGGEIFNLLSEWIKDNRFNATQLSIAWTLYTKGVTSAICGSKNPEQAISNAKAGDIELTQDDISEINKLTENISIYDLITPKRFG